MSQLITKLRTACHYGGSRSWFGCPRCRRRVGVLFLRGAAGFMCRHCARLVYSSQAEDEMGRAWRKQRKAEARLVDGWQRLKGMHESTRRKLLAVIWACEERREDALAAYVSKHFPGGLGL